MAKNFKKDLSNLVGKKPEAEAQEELAQTPASTEEEQEETEEEALLNTISDTELRAKLKARQTKDRGRRKKGEETTSSTDGWGRVCLIMKEDTYKKIKLISLRDSLQIKEVVEGLIKVGLKHYEEKYGEVKPIEVKPQEDRLSKFKDL